MNIIFSTKRKKRQKRGLKNLHIYELPTVTGLQDQRSSTSTSRHAPVTLQSGSWELKLLLHSDWTKVSQPKANKGSQSKLTRSFVPRASHYPLRIHPH